MWEVSHTEGELFFVDVGSAERKHYAGLACVVFVRDPAVGTSIIEMMVELSQGEVGCSGEGDTNEYAWEPRLIRGLALTPIVGTNINSDAMPQSHL